MNDTPPLRLLFVSHSFPPPGQPLANLGGMQRVATELHAALGAHPAVVLDDILLRTTWERTNLRTLPFLARAGWGIARRVRARAIDAVLFSSMVTAATSVPLQHLLAAHGIPSAAIAHGRDVTLPFPPYQRWLVPCIFEALDAVLPVSRATGAACEARGLPPHKLHVVPNGVAPDRFPPLADRRTMRAALQTTLGEPAAPLPDEALLLCSVGRQVERKGFAWFVDHVMPALPEDVHYWLAGDGPEADAIAAAAERQGLQGRVRRLGRISDEALIRLYRGADLFVMPNIPVPGDMEGFGVVMLEAGLGGLPIVAAALEGIRDVVTEGENGHLVPSGDAAAFREAILRYRHDRSALEAASQRAAQYTAATFSWPAVAGRYVQVLRSLATSTAVAEQAS